MHAVHETRSFSGGMLTFAHPVRNVGMLSLEPGMRVADFGAGSGAYALALAEAVTNGGAVYAVDVQKDLLRRIANNAKTAGFKTVHVIVGDLEKPKATKLSEKILDFVLISNLLFQAEDKKAVVMEARRILKPTGRLAIIDWTDSLPAGRQASVRIGPQKKAVVTKARAQELAIECGFGLVREFEAGEHHYGLLFKKTLV